MTNLFEAAGLEKEAPRPLADRLRPKRLAEVVGQDHLVGPEGTLTRMLRSGRLQSMILWGPPGSGKTTVARLLADETKLAFEQLSAIFSGVQDLRKAFDRAKGKRETGNGTLLFIDEIHRFNRSQQDSFLPLHGGRHDHAGRRHHREPILRAQRRLAVARRGAGVPSAGRCGAGKAAAAGRGRRKGARCRSMPRRARRSRPWPTATGARRSTWSRRCSARSRPAQQPLDREALTSLVQRRAPLYDKSRDGHYNLISALHKSVRGSDPDASLYWLARMLDGGEDRLFIARRLVRMAIEDIGLADPQALVQALAAKDVYDFLGTPEGELALAQATVYLATAPKSNAAYMAYNASHARGQGARQPGAAQAHPERADAADGRGRLRPGLCLRPRRAGSVLGPELFSRRHGSASNSMRRRGAASRPS